MDRQSVTYLRVSKCQSCKRKRQTRILTTTPPVAPIHYRRKLQQIIMPRYHELLHTKDNVPRHLDVLTSKIASLHGYPQTEDVTARGQTDLDLLSSTQHIEDRWVHLCRSLLITHTNIMCWRNNCLKHCTWYLVYVHRTALRRPLKTG